MIDFFGRLSSSIKVQIFSKVGKLESYTQNLSIGQLSKIHKTKFVFKSCFCASSTFKNSRLFFKMPFIKVFTNQSQTQLGEKFMPTVCEKLGQALNKDLKWFNWILETDKQMSKVTICFLLVKLPIFPTFLGSWQRKSAFLVDGITSFEDLWH